MTIDDGRERHVAKRQAAGYFTPDEVQPEAEKPKTFDEFEDWWVGYTYGGVLGDEGKSAAHIGWNARDRLAPSPNRELVLIQPKPGPVEYAEALKYIQEWARQDQSPLTSRQVADAVVQMIEDLLAAYRGSQKGEGK